MRCDNCGTESQAGVKFCGECGTSLLQSQTGYNEASITQCSNCGFEVPDGSRFCSECGNEVAVAYHDTYSGSTGTGVRGSNQQNARVKIFYGKEKYVRETAQTIERLLRNDSLMTQLIDNGDEIIIQGKRNGNVLKSALGLEVAVTATVSREGNDLKLTVGAGKWMDKAIGAGIGIFLFWPTLLTTGWGIYMQQKLFSKIESETAMFLNSMR